MTFSMAFRKRNRTSVTENYFLISSRNTSLLNRKEVLTRKVLGSVIRGLMRMKCRQIKPNMFRPNSVLFRSSAQTRLGDTEKDQSVSVQRTRIRLKKTWVLNLVEIRKFQKPKPLRALIRERKFHGLRFYFYKP